MFIVSFYKWEKRAKERERERKTIIRLENVIRLVNGEREESNKIYFSVTPPL
jgi:hypothetical protein